MLPSAISSPAALLSSCRCSSADASGSCTLLICSCLLHAAAHLQLPPARCSSAAASCSFKSTRAAVTIACQLIRCHCYHQRSLNPPVLLISLSVSPPAVTVPHTSAASNPSKLHPQLPLARCLHICSCLPHTAAHLQLPPACCLHICSCLLYTAFPNAAAACTLLHHCSSTVNFLLSRCCCHHQLQPKSIKSAENFLLCYCLHLAAQPQIHPSCIHCQLICCHCYHWSLFLSCSATVSPPLLHLQLHCITHHCSTRSSLLISNLCGNPSLLLPAAHHRCSSTCSSPPPLLLHLRSCS